MAEVGEGASAACIKATPADETEVSDRHQCPAGHPLKAHYSWGGDYACDKCSEKFEKLERLHRCAKCDYDACENCMAKAREQTSEQYEQAARIVFLPIQIQDKTVLIKEAENVWKVTNEFLQSPSPFFSCRNTKNFDDKAKEILKDGSLITGLDEGDGWVRCDVRALGAHLKVGDSDYWEGLLPPKALPTSQGFSAREESPDGQADWGFRHRRTAGEVHRCKKGERNDLKVSQWDKFNYASTDILSRPIVYGGNVVEIPRVKASDISPQWFYDNAAVCNKPFIVEGACSHWAAMERWSIPRLEERFRHTSFKVGSDKKGRKLRMKFKYFADYMEKQRDDSPLYLFETGINSNADMNKLMDDFTSPELFPHDWFSLMNHESRPPFRWWCIGPKRSGTTVHVDPLGTSAWNAVTSGVKRWILFEPSASKRVVKGKDLMKKGEDDEAVMYFDFVLPRIKEAHPDLRIYEGLQKPGDIIFVPGDWWHGVLNIEDCVAVTQNYCGPDNFENIWTRTRAEREKVASLWLRNMRKFAPELYRWACELNARDGFRMRNERAAGDKLAGDKSGSSDSSSSDSTSDEDVDVGTPRMTVGLDKIAVGMAAAVVAPRKRTRERVGWDPEPAPAEANDGENAAPLVNAGTLATSGVASPIKAQPAERENSKERKRRRTKKKN